VCFEEAADGSKNLKIINIFDKTYDISHPVLTNIKIYNTIN
jgi:hypothetical protein